MIYLADSQNSWDFSKPSELLGLSWVPGPGLLAGHWLWQRVLGGTAMPVPGESFCPWCF